MEYFLIRYFRGWSTAICIFGDILVFSFGETSVLEAIELLLFTWVYYKFISPLIQWLLAVIFNVSIKVNQHIGRQQQRQGRRNWWETPADRFARNASNQVGSWLTRTMQPSQSNRNSAYEERRKEDARVWKRTQLQNEAIFQQSQAKKNAGTYSGYQAHNKAQAARNEAKNL